MVVQPRKLLHCILRDLIKTCLFRSLILSLFLKANFRILLFHTRTSYQLCMRRLVRVFAGHTCHQVHDITLMDMFVITSSLPILMFSVTSVNTVGSTKYPFGPRRAPPHASLAPSFFPLSISPRIFLNCSSSICNFSINPFIPEFMKWILLIIKLGHAHFRK